jgi:hypothetical protein
MSSLRIGTRLHDPDKPFIAPAHLFLTEANPTSPCVERSPVFLARCNWRLGGRASASAASWAWSAALFMILDHLSSLHLQARICKLTLICKTYCNRGLSVWAQC